jgi:hypothetical protein
MKKLLLFLSMVLFASRIFAQDVIWIDGDTCGMHGDAKRKQEFDQNPYKNRYKPPTSKDIDTKITVQKLVAGGSDRDRFKQSTAVEITGYVFDVKQGGKETCNCHTGNALFKDTHIEITPNSKETSPDKRLIIEVTPRMRKIMEDKGIDWSTATLMDKKNGIIGHTIKVQGWLFYDFTHEDDAFSYDPNDEHDTGKDHKNWRASCWEVHPITYMEDLTPVSDEEETPISNTAVSLDFYSNNTPAPSPTPKYNPDKPMETHSASTILVTLLLGAFLGMLGQGLRMFVGISKANKDPQNKDKKMNEYIELRRVVFSFIYAFIIGAITGGLMAMDHIGANWSKTVMMGIVTAGYAGTDFIEGFIHKNFS